jgi:hypothetical protein
MNQENGDAADNEPEKAKCVDPGVMRMTVECRRKSKIPASRIGGTTMRK